MNYSTQIPTQEYIQNCRDKRYRRQKRSADIAGSITGHRVQYCLKSVTGSGAQLMYSQKHSKAFFKGLATCGSSWDCPVCAHKISVRRAEEIRGAGDAWKKICPSGSVFMITFTVQHSKDTELAGMVEVMNQALRWVKSGRKWQYVKERYQIRGSITGTHITVGKNGWHYHKHMMIFTELPPGNDYGQGYLGEYLKYEYVDFLELNGYSADPEIAVKVSESKVPDKIIEDYISSWGLDKELTSQEGKDSITPFDLLDDESKIGLWVEYSKTMKGRAVLVWSRGLRSLLGLGAEKTDEEIAAVEEEQDAILIWNIPQMVWSKIYHRGLRAELLARVERSGGCTGVFMDWLRDRDLLPVLERT